MLRLRPTAISLTRTDVTEVIHRRRFRKFLECDNPEACVALTPTGTEEVRNIPSQPSSSRTTKATPGRSAVTGSSPPSMAYSRVRPLVADLPLLLSPDKPFDEDLSPSPEAFTRRSRRGGAGAGVDQKQGLSRTMELCIRPKRSLPVATTAKVDVDPDGSADTTDLLENPKHESHNEWSSMAQGDVAASSHASPVRPPDSRSPSPTPQASARSLRARSARVSGAFVNPEMQRKGGPSTPKRTSSLGSPATHRSAPVASAPASPDPFDDSNFCLEFDGSPSDVSSPLATFKTSGRLRVYNDLLPASSQPQTPQDLAEARHQSRLQGSYTAPARRTSPQPVQTPTTTRPRRRFGSRRELSPLGFQTPGFMGLYGGMENADDPVLLEETAEERARS